MLFEELFHTMRQGYANARFPVVLADTALHIYWCNPEAVRQLPLQSDGTGGYRWPDFLPVAEILWVLQNGNPFSFPLTNGSRSGLLFLPVMEQDSLIGCQVIGDARTEKPLEAEPEIFQNMMEAHDKRTKLPLTIIFSTLGLLVREVRGNSVVLGYIKLILQNGYRMLRFFETFSDLMRLRMEKNPLHLKNGDIAKLIKSICDAAGALTAEIEIPISCQIPPKPVLTRFDPVRLQRAFLNLISNACLYTRPNNQITVRVEAVGSNVVVTVSDRGAGMDAEILASFMGTGNMVSSGSQYTDNHGIGLHFVKTVVEKHGGMLVIDSCLGGGTHVAFTLPLCEKGDLPVYLAQEKARYLKNRFSAVYVELSDVCGVPMP